MADQKDEVTDPLECAPRCRPLPVLCRGATNQQEFR